MNGYAFHPEARFDLDEIWEFIRADNLDAADRVIAEILGAGRGLVPFPHQGHRRPDLTRRAIRFNRVRDYLISYAPDESPLWVLPFSMATAARAPWQPFSEAGKAKSNALAQSSIETLTAHLLPGNVDREEGPNNDH